MVGYIYLITDTTNGMKYTGKHHYHIEGQLDPSYHGSGVIIKNIYKKRPETLKEEYIKTCYSEEEMCSDEQYYIKVFKTLWPNGYNLTEGGEGFIPCEEIRKKISEACKGLQAGEKNPMFGKNHSEKTKKKMSVSIRKSMTSDVCKKISDSKKGKPAHNKGVPMSEEQKKKLSKKVLQFTLNGEFIREWPSISECGRNGFSTGAIWSCCNGKLKTHKGFKWCYA